MDDVIFNHHDAVKRELCASNTYLISVAAATKCRASVNYVLYSLRPGDIGFLIFFFDHKMPCRTSYTLSILWFGELVFYSLTANQIGNKYAPVRL